MDAGIIDKSATIKSGIVQTYRVKAHAYNRRTRFEEKVEMLITIDWEALASMMGTACLRNKTGKARLAGGYIKATVVKP